MFDKRKAYREKMDAQFKEWNAQFEELKAKAQKGTADAKLDFERKVDHLKRSHDEAQQRYEHLNSAPESKWDELSAGVDDAVKDMRDAWNRAFPPQ